MSKRPASSGLLLEIATIALVAVGAGFFVLIGTFDVIGPHLVSIFLGVLSGCLVAVSIVLARDRTAGLNYFHPALLVCAFYVTNIAVPALITTAILNNYAPSEYAPSDATPTDFNVTLAYCVVATCALLVGLRLRGTNGSAERQPPVVPLGAAFGVLAATMIALGLAGYAYHLSLFGSLGLDMLSFLSPGLRRGAEISPGNWVLVLESFADWGLALLWLKKFSRDAVSNVRGTRSLWLPILLTLTIAVLSYLSSGKRSKVIPLLVVPIILRHCLIAPIRLKGALLFSALAAALIVGLLLARIILPVVVTTSEVPEDIGAGFLDAISFYLRTAELATFDIVTLALLHRDALLEHAGGVLEAIFLFTFGTLIFFIPRVIWPGKPEYLDASHIFFQVATGNTWDSVGFAGTLYGVYVLYGGALGAVLLMAITGVLSERFTRAFTQRGRVFMALLPLRSSTGRCFSTYGLEPWALRFFKCFRACCRQCSSCFF